jgi:hypothetical protein
VASFRIMPPLTKHVVATLDNTIMVGGHFYGSDLLADLFVSYINLFFLSKTVTNTKHIYLISVIQSFAMLW